MTLNVTKDPALELSWSRSKRHEAASRRASFMGASSLGGRRATTPGPRAALSRALASLRSEWWLQGLIAVTVIAYGVSTLVVHRPPSGYNTFWDGWVENIASALPAIPLLLRARRSAELRTAWLAMAAGVMLYTIADLVYTYHDQNLKPIPCPRSQRRLLSVVQRGLHCRLRHPDAIIVRSRPRQCAPRRRHRRPGHCRRCRGHMVRARAGPERPALSGRGGPRLPGVRSRADRAPGGRPGPPPLPAQLDHRPADDGCHLVRGRQRDLSQPERRRHLCSRDTARRDLAHELLLHRPGGIGARPAPLSERSFLGQFAGGHRRGAGGVRGGVPGCARRLHLQALLLGGGDLGHRRPRPRDLSHGDHAARGAPVGGQPPGRRAPTTSPGSRTDGPSSNASSRRSSPSRAPPGTPACCWSTSTASRKSTMLWATRPATSFCASWPSGSSTGWAIAVYLPASGATSTPVPAP